MPVVITGIGPRTPVYVAVSPLAELGSALHVLQDPGHHDRTEWAAGVRAVMSARLRALTDRWSWTVQKHRSTPFVTMHAPDEDFDLQRKRLRALAPADLAAGLLRPLRRTGESGLGFSAARAPGVDALVEALRSDPGPAVAEFLEFLDITWDEWFEAEWQRVRPALAARARDFAQMASVHGTTQAVAALDAGLSATGDGVSLAEVCHTRHDVSRRGLAVVPSAFTRPHLWVVDVPDQPLVLIPGLDDGPVAPSSTQMLARLTALAHPVRLKIAQAIATEALTAGEVARIVGTDPTLVNRHLRHLNRSGLTHTARRGRYVQYRLHTGAVAALGTDTLTLLLK
jgi:DNA-binding transcriptional ArsR family regulator